MDPETIRLLYSYDRWVNTRLLETAGELSEDELRETYGASFDTIFGTLAHMLGSQMAWLSRWKGVTPEKQIGAQDFGSMAELTARWEQHNQDLDKFLAEITLEKLAAPLTYKNYAGQSFTLPLGQLMLHAANHGTHHRSELADMLTRAGHAPRPTDLVRYCLAISGQE